MPSLSSVVLTALVWGSGSILASASSSLHEFGLRVREQSYFKYINGHHNVADHQLARNERLAQDASAVQTGYTADKTSYAVTDLGKYFPDLTAFAGYIPLTTDKSSQLFFWYYPSANKASDNLVIWLNGGPGCSSIVGDFIENGPFAVQDDGSFKQNPYSWHLTANVLYVEQPVGTGFAYASSNDSYARNEYDIAFDFYTFLDGFYGVFPETKPYNLYITGESYAGVYIPYIGQYLLDAVHFSDQTSINLRGVAIGNGLIDSKSQSHYRAIRNDFDFLKERNFFGNDNAAWTRAGNIAEACTKNSSDFEHIDYQCDLYSFLSDYRANQTHGAFNCTNIYNIDQPCNVTDAKQNQMSTFLNLNSVQAALHVSPLPAPVVSEGGWLMCSDVVGNFLYENIYNFSTVNVIPKIIDSGVPVFLYNGDRDFILHYVGYERAIGNMTWANQKGSANFPLTLTSANWKSADKSVDYGYMVENDRGLWYFRVFNAGHMVPSDQPAAGQDILKRLLDAPKTRSLPPPGPPVSVNTATATIPLETDPATPTETTSSSSVATSYGSSTESSSTTYGSSTESSSTYAGVSTRLYSAAPVANSAGFTLIVGVIMSVFLLML